MEKLAFHSKCPQRTIPSKKSEYKGINVRTEKSKVTIIEKTQINIPNLLQETSISPPLSRPKPQKNQHPVNVGRRREREEEKDLIFPNDFKNPHQFPQPPMENLHFPSTLHF